MKFLAGATVRIHTEIYDIDDALVDPTTSVTITITDPTGTAAVTNGAMSTSSTGIYDYYYTSTVDVKYGTWRFVIKATDSSYISYDSGTFVLERFSA